MASDLVLPRLVPVFVSFDYDNDHELKTLFLGQAKHRSTPYRFADWSIKEASDDWQDRARERIKRSEQVIVICGLQTHRATGVAREIRSAREERKPYFLLRGRAKGRVRRPPGAAFSTVQDWKWDNIERLLAGRRNWYFDGF
jgi:hypothetical protein